MRYRQGWKALNRLLHEDRSFSGHERNCMFLNTQGQEGNERFADISAASGFDFPDDGRAVALCDWDFDGDLDLWVTNRTAPRIRLLRNNSERKNHFLAIKLQGDGQSTNRDAVGARIEVILEGNDSRPLIKTMTAGDGFVSQSSGWMHLGLGASPGIREVIVRWPGSEQRTYRGFQLDQRYVIDQRAGTVNLWTPPAGRKPLEASSQEPLVSSGVARTVLPFPQLLPSLRVAERDEPLNRSISRPTIISIWSATCTSCVQELNTYVQQADRLRHAGLDVMAINLDNLEGDTESSDEILKSIAFPFTAVSGTTELVRSLDILKRAIFDRWQTLAVPTSFLVDERGFVCVIYQGPVEIDQLLADLQLLHVSPERRRNESTPFAGRWIMPTAAADPLHVVSRFIDEAMMGPGIEYLERHVQLAEQSRAPVTTDNESPGSTDQEPSDLYYVLGVILREQQQPDAAIKAFQKAIQHRPDDFRFRNDFANLLAETGHLDEAAEQLQEASRINSQEPSVQRKLAFVRVALGQHAAAIQQFRKVLEAEPKDVACWYNLANSFRAAGQLEEAVKTYRHTLAIEPQMALAANNLSWLLATSPRSDIRDGAEAVRWATQICEQTKYAHPSFLDTLACAYAELGDFNKAIATADMAIERLDATKDADAVRRIRARVESFRRQQPFRDQAR